MKLVIFDGYCGLCNHFVDFLIRNDRHRHLRYTPIQGETVKPFGLSEQELAYPTSVIFSDENIIYRESAGVLHAVMAMGGMWKMAGLFLIVPSVIRDFVYRQIAKRRYRLFGKRDVCRLPTKEERGLILP